MGFVCFKFHPTNYIKTWSLGYLGSPKAPFLLSFFGFLPFVFAFSLALLLSQLHFLHCFSALFFLIFRCLFYCFSALFFLVFRCPLLIFLSPLLPCLSLPSFTVFQPSSFLFFCSHCSLLSLLLLSPLSFLLFSSQLLVVLHLVSFQKD